MFIVCNCEGKGEWVSVVVVQNVDILDMHGVGRKYFP